MLAPSDRGSEENRSDKCWRRCVHGRKERFKNPKSSPSTVNTGKTSRSVVNVPFKKEPVPFLIPLMLKENCSRFQK